MLLTTKAIVIRFYGEFLADVYENRTHFTLKKY